MISYIKGTLTAVGESEVIVEAGSFGIEVKTSRAVIDRLPAPGKELILYTHFKLSEDAVALYGFDREADLRLFRALIAVSGIGPKGALAVLSALEPEALKLAVLSGDAKAIAKAPGVGIRTAERIILELKNKEVIQELTTGGVAAAPSENRAMADAMDALVQLGYSVSEAARAVRAIPGAEDKDSETLLREALRQF